MTTYRYSISSVVTVFVYDAISGFVCFFGGFFAGCSRVYLHAVHRLNLFHPLLYITKTRLFKLY